MRRRQIWSDTPKMPPYQKNTAVSIIFRQRGFQIIAVFPTNLESHSQNATFYGIIHDMSDSYIERTIETDLRHLIDRVPVIAVTGSRQTGKTTLLAHLEEHHRRHIHYVTLDDIATRQKALSDPVKFIDDLPTPVIIDEFQYAPEILSPIKIKVDKMRLQSLFHGSKRATLYFLTGSQIFQATKNLSESLAGRVGLCQLNPLTWRELNGVTDRKFVPQPRSLRHRQTPPHLNKRQLAELIFEGFYPEIHTLDRDPQEFYNTYVRTYIERDLNQIINVKDELRFYTFMQALATRTGQEYNANDLARDVQISNKTVDHWLSILRNTHLIYLLQPYFPNRSARAIKSPKVYFLDTGLACFLSGFADSNELLQSATYGRYFETYVVATLVKSFDNHLQDPRFSLYFLRDRDGHEIDLIIKYAHELYALEIKATDHPDNHDFNNMWLAHNLDMPISEQLVICNCQSITNLSLHRVAVPVEYL